ncbi:MAG: hypothetical protein ACRDKG_00970 [Actinomycetota bacterium]
MGLTTDPRDPALGRGVDDEPVPQQEKYLILSDEERAKGFVRPVRRSYRHVGPPGPRHPLRELTEDELERYTSYGYVKFEAYPGGGDSAATGRFWTQPQLDAVGKGCGVVTTMAEELAETYARDPDFYGATYCVNCRMHRPVGPAGEFVWDDGSNARVGT